MLAFTEDARTTDPGYSQLEELNITTISCPLDLTMSKTTCALHCCPTVSKAG